MATEQYTHGGEDGSLTETSTTLNGCFDCNICLDNAHDPVVTLCGHLYCWPCIYKWLHFQGSSFTPEDQQQCPVCKAGISQTTIVPLYGRGQSSETNHKGTSQNFDIPRRPQACGVHALISSATSTSTPNHDDNRFGYPYRDQGSSIVPRGLHPMIGMLGEMVHTRVFGNSSGASLYWHRNAYNHMRNSSPRVRRQEMQAEKSLNRVSIFLFCCFVVCLLLF